MSVKRSLGATPGFGSTPAVVSACLYKTTLQTNFVTLVQCAFQTVLWDTEGTIADTTNDLLLVPYDGIYNVGGQLLVTNGTTSYQEIQLYKNSSRIHWIFRGATQASSEYRPWNMTLELAAGDELEIWAILPNSTWEQIRDTSTFYLTFLGAL